jgi:hypothetical protein
MMPGGHLVTALGLSALAYASTGSAEGAAGCFAGGFLIDVDHYLDYIVFEKQWRRPGPLNFLRYYFSYRPRKLVLPLHSFELMTFLFVVMLAHPWPLLIGYWLGALMHLICDVWVNGDYALQRPVLFYIFAYRAARRFSADELLDVPAKVPSAPNPVVEFFRWRPRA